MFKNDDIILDYFKMDKAACMYPDLNDQTFRLSKIDEFKD